MNETKSVNKIRVSLEFEKYLYNRQKERMLMEQAEKALKTFDILYYAIEKCWENKKIVFEEKTFEYYTDFNLFLDTDVSEFKIDPYENIIKMEDFKPVIDKAELLSLEEARGIYCDLEPAELRPKCYLRVLCCYNNNLAFLNTEEKYFVDLEPSPELLLHIMYNKINSVRVPICYHLPSNLTKLEILIKYNLVPKNFTQTELLKNLFDLLSKNYVTINNDRISLTEEGLNAVRKGNCRKIGATYLKVLGAKKDNESLKINNVRIDLKNTKPEGKKQVLADYLSCDKLRANMDEYELKRLEDPNLGHWELWDEEDNPRMIELAEGNEVIARNPCADIQKDSIVGIDFGTKSTVVAFQDSSGKIKPMPIGCGNLRGYISNRDFENPTVMQFIDLEYFLARYYEKKGRPYTLWQDLIVSHAAEESMKDTGVRSEEFYSYFYDLKQWAGEGNQKSVLRDKTGKDYVLSSYRDIIANKKQDESVPFDPIQLYAYFIGLYVNNMNNGIYLDYLLSFPVTYEKQIRDSILESFKLGIMKSLPESILNDEDAMSQFSVVCGASEPAAYAICALQEYGMEPEPEENVFYGIFDFGGGTADFDFGIWSLADKEDVYDYCIQHFGSEGDRYLGGENLLQLLAFEVFKENIDTCRQEKIMFSKPLELVDIPVEIKGFVNYSQEARMNMKLMMEKLRPFWERTNAADGEQEETNAMNFSEFQVGLFDVDGNLKSNLAFEADVEVLEKILEERIEKGVRQFFHALKGTFAEKYRDKTIMVDKVNIFLAGNSSQSPILQKVFAKYINEWNQDIGKLESNEEQIESYFELFPPLGTKEAKMLQQERGMPQRDGLEYPTGKTGVAWGLIEGREGGRIEIKEEITADTETKFAYYLGNIVRRKFSMKISRDNEYQVWYRFMPALQKKIEVAYTSLPEATTGTLSGEDANVSRKRIELPVTGDDLYVYIRLTGREVIECGIGDDNGNVMEDTIKEYTF